MDWTDEAVAKLKDLSRLGQSNPEIAVELGCDTKDVYNKRRQLKITRAALGLPNASHAQDKMSTLRETPVATEQFSAAPANLCAAADRKMPKRLACALKIVHVELSKESRNPDVSPEDKLALNSFAIALSTAERQYAKGVI